MKRIDVSAVSITPEIVFYKYLHSDLSFWHARIINDGASGEAKGKALGNKHKAHTLKEERPEVIGTKNRKSGTGDPHLFFASLCICV